MKPLPVLLEDGYDLRAAIIQSAAPHALEDPAAWRGVETFGDLHHRLIQVIGLPVRPRRLMPMAFRRLRHALSEETTCNRELPPDAPALRLRPRTAIDAALPPVGPDRPAFFERLERRLGWSLPELDQAASLYARRRRAVKAGCLGSLSTTLPLGGVGVATGQTSLVLAALFTFAASVAAPAWLVGRLAAPEDRASWHPDPTIRTVGDLLWCSLIVDFHGAARTAGFVDPDACWDMIRKTADYAGFTDDDHPLTPDTRIGSLR